MAKHKEREKEHIIGLTANEVSPFSEVVMFRGDEFPANFHFIANEYDNPDISIPEYALLGYAFATMVDALGNPFDHDDVLVWEGGTVVRRRQERPRNKKVRRKTSKKS